MHIMLVHLHGRMTGSLHRHINRNSTGSPGRLRRMPRIMEPEVLHTGKDAGPLQRLLDRIVGDPVAILTDEHEISRLDVGDLGAPTLTADLLQRFTCNWSQRRD